MRYLVYYCDTRTARMADLSKDYMSNNTDPKNIQDLTTFVSILVVYRVAYLVTCKHDAVRYYVVIID